MRIARVAALAGFALLSLSTHAMAQLPIQLSFNAGIAKPMRNDADVYDSGFHLGAGLKIALIPVQVDATLDRMGGKGALDDVTVLGLTGSLRLSVTPPLSPVGLYFLAGGGLYSARNEVTETNIGLNAGAGVNLNLPFLKPFAEVRGIGLFSDPNKLTYATAAVGLRF